MFNQDENFQLAIRKKRARIEEISLILARPRPNGASGGFIRNLIEERLHLEQAIAELEAERHRLRFQNADKLFRWEDLDQRLLQVSPRDLLRTLAVMPDESISILQSHAWRSFHETFKALADEELTLEPRNMHDRWLRAHVSYEDRSLGPDTAIPTRNAPIAADTEALRHARD